MSWSEQFTQLSTPDFKEIASYISSPYWDDLNKFIQDTYSVEPTIEYSGCSLSPGWNVKYRKSSRALCTYIQTLESLYVL